MISTALKRNVWIDRGAYKIYPNQYIILVAKSGASKKSAAMDIGLDLIRNVKELRVLYGRMTVEGLIDYMDHASIRPDGKISPDGSVLIQADELAYLFGKQSYISDLLDFLTAAYTSRARLDFLTRNKGFRTVRNPCPSLMAACTLAQLGDIFPSITLVSGFMARTLLIYGVRTKRVAKPLLDRSLEEFLIHDLGCIAQLWGEFKMTQEAEDAFDAWYTQMGDPPTGDMESFYERRHDHVLKAALVLSVSESNEKIIRLDHFDSALKSIEFIESHYPVAVAAIGATQQSLVADQIVAIVSTVYPESMSHSVLLRRIYKRLTYGAAEFQQYIDDLKETKRIKENVGTKGTFYKIANKKTDKK